MRLYKLQLNNFMGVKEFTLNPMGKDISILGQNGAGKTTLATAICWLLFGKDSRGKADFEIKTLDETGEALHGLEHTVEADFEIHDGKYLTLKKTYAEKWEKKRGSASSTFTGHETLYWANGVPVKMKDYKEQVGAIADEEMFRLLTQPDYFPERLDWKKRRSILLEVCGDVSDQDVIASSAELQPLAAIIAGRSLDDHKRTVAASMKKINEELKNIPPRIDELARQTFGTDGEVDLAANKAQEVQALQDLDDIKARITASDAGSEAAQLKKELAQTEAAVLDIENLHRQELNEVAAGKEKELDGLRIRWNDLHSQFLAASGAHQRVCAAVPVDNRASINAEIEKLRAEWFEVDSLVYRPEEKACPTCGQQIPEAEDAEEQFNRRRAERLEQINAKGHELKGLLEAEEVRIVAATKQLADETAAMAEKVAKLEAEMNGVSTARDALAEEIKAIRSRPAMSRADYQEATVKIANLKSRIAAAQSGNASLEMDTLTRERDRLTSLLDRIRQRISLAETKAKNDTRIEELKAEEKRLAGEYERLANEVYLMEQFTRAKVDMLESAINSKFSLVKWKLFEDQINGGLQDCCSPTVSGVPYSSGLNTGSRINAGIDCINTLSAHYGISMMIIVDNSESITKLIDTDAQVIRLVVSPDHKTLTIA